MQPPLVDVRITKPLPSTDELAAPSVNPLVTNVEIETQYGGFGRLRIGLLAPDAARPPVYPSLPEPVGMERRSHVVASVGGHVLHEGMLQRWSVRRDGFESLGYGVTAGKWGSLDLATDDLVPADRIAATAIRAVDWWTLGEVPSATSYRPWSELPYHSAEQVIDTLAAEGSDGVPWLWSVYEGRVARLVAKTAPSVPDYRVAYDPDTMDIWQDDSGGAEAVRATYQDAGGQRLVTAWLYSATADPAATHNRRVTLTSTTADSSNLLVPFLRSWIDERDEPVLGGTITLGNWRGLTRPGGVMVPGYALRYGQWVEIEGYGIAVITRTTSNLTTGLTRVELSGPVAGSLAALLARVVGTTDRVRTGRDPITGNRARYDTGRHGSRR